MSIKYLKYTCTNNIPTQLFCYLLLYLKPGTTIIIISSIITHPSITEITRKGIYSTRNVQILFCYLHYVIICNDFDSKNYIFVYYINIDTDFKKVSTNIIEDKTFAHTKFV